MMIAEYAKSGGGTFDKDEVHYLRSLPAVRDVRNNRTILYSDEFKRECLSRYYAGETPSSIFRRAGLDPMLIGSKRIERCIARWKRERRGPESTASETDAEPSASAHEESKPMPEGFDQTVCMLIIAQQARRIKYLEQEISRLKAQVRHAESHHAESSDDTEEFNRGGG